MDLRRLRVVNIRWTRRRLPGLLRAARPAITNRVGRIFKWAVENELVPASVLHGLQAVSGLRYGRSEAREIEPVKPVPDAFVDAVLPHVAPQVAAMIQLQRITGMRSGEVTIMRGCDITIPCEHGHIYPHDDKLLGVATNRRGSKCRKLTELPGVTVRQDGTDGINCIFEVSQSPQVAAIVHPRRTRRLTAVEKEASIARLAKYRFPSAAQSDSDADSRDGAAEVTNQRLPSG